jgi:3-phosphoshikimate 1-carboxyvinyltransferase
VAIDGFGPDGPRFDGREWTVPGDFSSAAFWMTAAAARPGAEIVIEGVGLNRRRTAFMEVLGRMGADVRAAGDKGAGPGEWEPSGTVRVAGAELSGTEVGGSEVPNLIDELPLVAVLGALAGGRTVIRDAAELRVKESDRIAAMAAGLTAAGVEVEERPDGMVVAGGRQVTGGCTVDSRGDHRVAMAMAVLALAARRPVSLRNVACIGTSYPRFWHDLETVTVES